MKLPTALHAPPPFTDGTGLYATDALTILLAGDDQVPPQTILAQSSTMPVVDITSGQGFATIAAAITAAQSGDVIQISAGTYVENLPKISVNLTLEGVGGMPLIEAPAAGLANDEGILVVDANLTVIGLELTGAAGPTGNDAAIRFETGNLTVQDCWIQDNQEGILANPDPTATIAITNSEIDNNGDLGGPEEGYTHNIYIGQVADFTITGSYVHDALGGHEIKSRADNTTITNTRIQDGPTAPSNYSVDLPDGGNAILSGDTIEKGPNDPNYYSVHFGGELYPVYANSSLTITSTTFINDLDPATTTPAFVFNQAQNAAGDFLVPAVTGNTLYGLPTGQLLNDGSPDGSQAWVPVDPSLNTFLPIAAAPPLDTAHPFAVPCFTPGTLILTPSGERDVATLRIGDDVLTHAGHVRQVKWLGHRAYPAATVAANPTLHPIRIRAGALADGVPRTDLRLSPLHAVLLQHDDGIALFPAAALVNGVTILPCTDPGDISYIHVELEHHDILVANGAPAESFVDCRSRAMFDNAAEFARLYPHAPTTPARFCTDRIEDGPELAAARRRLAARAGLIATPRPPGHLRGHVEATGPGWAEGWVLDSANPDLPVELDLRRDGHPVAHAIANRYRGDLHAAGLTGGRCAFLAHFPPGPGPISVVRASDGRELPVAGR